MIGYVTIGTNDLEKAATFYDAVLGQLGAARAMTDARMIMWAAAPDKPLIAVCKPHDGEAATVGNGMMVSLIVESQDKAKAVYDTAIAQGATDEGAPGLRGGNFYAGYFRDLDGNKLAAFNMG